VQVLHLLAVSNSTQLQSLAVKLDGCPGRDCFGLLSGLTGLQSLSLEYTASAAERAQAVRAEAARLRMLQAVGGLTQLQSLAVKLDGCPDRGRFRLLSGLTGLSE
jgi:hypothetical protein